MARPKKSVEKKIEEAMEQVAAQLPRAESEEQKSEIEHAVGALAEAIEPKVVGEKYVGKHPVTGEKMYV